MKILITEKDFLQKIPQNPGVYRFYGDTSIEEKPLYVGKAINLNKRITSYFRKSSTLSPRISLMVKKITSIEITITEDEVSALVLENNLIKSLKPKYNILFRDDKTYPLLRITNEQFPRIDSYRGSSDNRHQYFGPYPNVHALRYSLDMIQKLFKIRTCNNTTFKNRSRPCMLYQINRCTAPCVNLVTEEEYLEQISLAIDFLNGNYKSIITKLNLEMSNMASKEEFEEAACIRDEINLIKSIELKQIINDYNKPINTDIIVVREVLAQVFIYVIIVRGGIYVSDNHFVIDNQDAKSEEIFKIFLENHYFTRLTTVKQNAKFFIHTKIPVDNETKALLHGKITLKNVFSKELNKLYHMGEVNLDKIIAKSTSKEILINSVNELAHLLNSQQINRIECIDVSHNQGNNTVASLVVFANGILDNTLYRRYNLSTDESGNKINGNDLLAQKLVLTRRLENTERPLPEVIIVDGGLTQLSGAKEVLRAKNLASKIILLAIFKGEKRDPTVDSVILPGGRIINYSDNKVLFKLFHALRDEAHRFAITGHRKKEIKRMQTSILEEIPNIGSKKRQLLLKYFGSTKNIQEATLDDLNQVSGIGPKLAKEIYNYFHNASSI